MSYYPTSLASLTYLINLKATQPNMTYLTNPTDPARPNLTETDSCFTIEMESSSEWLYDIDHTDIDHTRHWSHQTLITPFVK